MINNVFINDVLLFRCSWTDSDRLQDETSEIDTAKHQHSGKFFSFFYICSSTTVTSLHFQFNLFWFFFLILCLKIMRKVARAHNVKWRECVRRGSCLLYFCIAYFLSARINNLNWISYLYCFNWIVCCVYIVSFVVFFSCCFFGSFSFNLFFSFSVLFVLVLSLWAIIFIG